MIHPPVLGQLDEGISPEVERAGASSPPVHVERVNFTGIRIFPTRLVLKNAGKEAHYFVAEQFFKRKFP